MHSTHANQAAFPQQRWQVELDIRNIEQTMSMDKLSCKTPDMAVKEIWVYLLAYNLIRLMMTQSALLADVIPRAIKRRSKPFPLLVKLRVEARAEVRKYEHLKK
jgi:hypothetical protein